MNKKKKKIINEAWKETELSTQHSYPLEEGFEHGKGKKTLPDGTIEEGDFSKKENFGAERLMIPEEPHEPQFSK